MRLTNLWLFCITKTPEPTGSGTFLSFEAKIRPNLTADVRPPTSVSQGRALARPFGTFFDTAPNLTADF